MLNLLLKEIEDQYVRENFKRILSFVETATTLQGEFKFFEVDIAAASSPFKLRHGLSFVPKDILVTFVEGDHRFYFEYQNFTNEEIWITTLGPARIRFLAGRYSNQGYDLAKRGYPLVPP